MNRSKEYFFALELNYCSILCLLLFGQPRRMSTILIISWLFFFNLFFLSCFIMFIYVWPALLFLFVCKLLSVILSFVFLLLFYFVSAFLDELCSFGFLDILLSYDFLFFYFLLFYYWLSFFLVHSIPKLSFDLFFIHFALILYNRLLFIQLCIQLFRLFNLRL